MNEGDLGPVVIKDAGGQQVDTGQGTYYADAHSVWVGQYTNANLQTDASYTVEITASNHGWNNLIFKELQGSEDEPNYMLRFATDSATEF